MRRGVLGIAWVNGVFCAGVYRRQNRIAGWHSPAPVHSLEEFASALDTALETLGFRGVETFLVLGHSDLTHQIESAPGFSDKAAMAYLKNLMRRRNDTGEPCIWACQKTAGDRRTSGFLVHQMPRRLYDAINDIMYGRHLELARIHPFSVPVQQLLIRNGKSSGKPQLIACNAGSATAFAVANERGEILFSRTTMSTWESNPGRTALEINRSLLYAKQQFGAPVERVILASGDVEAAEAAKAVVREKCPDAQAAVHVLATPLHWLDVVRGLGSRREVNLLARHLRRTKRNRLLRTAILVAGWLTLSYVAADVLKRQENWEIERNRLENLAAVADELRVEHDRLEARNDRAAQAEAFITAVGDEVLPPVPSKFLVYLADILPREARLSEYSVKWNPERNSWHFAFHGSIEADDETAYLAETALRRQLAKGPFQAQLAPKVSTATLTSFGGTNTALQQFNLEGDVYDD